MARKVRVQYPAAICHAVNHGDRQETIFKDEEDRQTRMPVAWVTERLSMGLRCYQSQDTFYVYVLSHVVASDSSRDFDEFSGLAPLFRPGDFVCESDDMTSRFRLSTTSCHTGFERLFLFLIRPAGYDHVRCVTSKCPLGILVSMAKFPTASSPNHLTFLNSEHAQSLSVTTAVTLSSLTEPTSK